MSTLDVSIFVNEVEERSPLIPILWDDGSIGLALRLELADMQNGIAKV